MDNQQQSATTPTAYTFPPISQLFKDSWQTFTQSILSLFILNIVGIVIYLGLGVLAVLIFILSGVGSILLKNGLQGITANLPSIITGSGFMGLIITASVIAVIFGLAYIIVGSVLQIASILIVNNQGKTPLGNTLRKGLSLIIPLSLVSILTFFLIFGALFVFLLPALLFYFLLSFVQYEVILNNQRWMGAIKSSVTIVSKHFGAILIRLILLILIYLGYTVITNLLSKIGSDTAILVGIISFIINLLLGWFSLAYTITLYKQAKTGLEQEKGKGIAWMWVVAIIGWLIAIGLGFVTYKTISSGVLNNLFNKAATNTLQQASLPTSQLLQSGSIKLSTANQIANQSLVSQSNLTSDQKNQIIGLINGALEDFNSATEENPNNYQAWYYRGIAYKSLISIAPNAKQFATESFQKALELVPQNNPDRSNIEDAINSL